MNSDNPHGYIFADRGSQEWDGAWQALIATGRSPEEYMLMHGETCTDGTRWGFKHIHSREYAYVIA